ncbi:MAG TPA: cytochrome b/b6 domain-containing protein [Caulobacteraceae bacterium]|nr:cytochrome b/b6 domain-containing protein [Caulobacteraceae bacterium]
MSPATEPGAGRARYNAVAIALHWLIAALLIANIGLAWYFNTLSGLAKVPPTQLHKSIGVTILLLSVLRLAWRLVNPPPPLPGSVKGWERLAAETVYVLFYGVMIGMPLSGWALSSASRLIGVYPITLFGLVHWPAIDPLTHLPTAQMHRAHTVFDTTHKLLAKLAYALIALHLAAALRHQFLKRDEVMGRMVPFL